MDPADAHVIQVIASTVAAAAMIVLGRAQRMLDTPTSRRCAACGRLRDRGRSCRYCAERL